MLPSPSQPPPSNGYSPSSAPTTAPIPPGPPPPLPPPFASGADVDLSSLPLVTGTVRWFNAEKGWGFVAPNPGYAGQGSDAFVHQNQLQSDGFRTLEPNQQVEYRLRISDKGKHIAMAVTAPGGGKLPGPSRDAALGRFGRERGDGRGDRDRDRYPPSHEHRPLDAPPLLSYYPPPPSPHPSPYALLPTPPGYHHDPSQPPYDHRNARPPHLPYCTGQVKSFDQQRGYGFLVATSSSAPHHLPPPTTDVFCHQSNIHMEGRRELAVGLVVEFALGVDEKSGKPLATHVTGRGGRLITREEVEEALHRGGVGGGEGIGGGGRVGGPEGYGAAGGLPRVGDKDSEINRQMMPKDPRVYVGEVLTFDLPKRYGFIKQEEGKENLFLHASRIDIPAEDIVRGMPVEYQIGVDPKGKDAAVNIRVIRRPPTDRYPPPVLRLSPHRGPAGYGGRDARALSPTRRYDEFDRRSPGRRAGGYEEWDRDREWRGGRRSPARDYPPPPTMNGYPSAYPPPSSNAGYAPPPPPPPPAAAPPRDYYDPYRSDPRYAAAAAAPPTPAPAAYPPQPTQPAPPAARDPYHQQPHYQQPPAPSAALSPYHYPPHPPTSAPTAAPSAAPHYAQQPPHLSPSSWYQLPPAAHTSAPAPPAPYAYPSPPATTPAPPAPATRPPPVSAAPPPPTSAAASSSAPLGSAATDQMLAHLYSLYSEVSGAASRPSTTTSQPPPAAAATQPNPYPPYSHQPRPY